MGLAQGKLTIPHVEDKMKAERASDPTQAESTKETASQLVNGDANAMCNVPPIDEAIEETDARKDSSYIHSAVADSTAESIPNGDQSVANGTVGSAESAVETDHVRKRNKNPLVWIKRRLSKKSNETGRPSTNRAAVSEDVATPVQEKPEESLVAPDTQASSDYTLEKQAEITEAAISLVEEVLSSAMTAQTDEVVENSHVAEEANVESQVPSERPAEDEPPTNISSELTTQQENAPASPEPASEVQTCSINGDRKDEENGDKSVDMVHSCTDMKCPRVTEPESSANHPDDEAVTTKLAGMDLSNGHSYGLTNGDNLDSEAAEHSEIVH